MNKNSHDNHFSQLFHEPSLEVTQAFPLELREKFDGLKPELNISHWGWTPLETPQTYDHYTSWIESGYSAEMHYLKDHLILKKLPQNLRPELQSAFVFAFSYLPHPEPQAHPLSSLKTAQYAQGFDYHFWIKARLNKMISLLKVYFPGESFYVFTDSAPIMERDLASKARLGWFGKNTCLIHPKKGSFFLIGEILTSWRPNRTEIVQTKTQEAQVSLPDLCGKCQLCLESCPTKALVAPRVLDANKCISFWTIETQNTPPLEIREKIGDHFFGCDICQTVCPWNGKILKNLLQNQPSQMQTHEISHQPHEQVHRQEPKPKQELEYKQEQGLNSQPLSHHEAAQLLTEESLIWLLESSNNQIKKNLNGSPLLRAGVTGLKKNALIVIGNKKIVKLKPQVQKYLQHSSLQELAIWCLEKLS